MFTNKLNNGVFNDLTDQFWLLCLYSRGCRVCWPITSHGWCWRIWTRPEFEVCQVGSVMEPQNTCGFFSEIKKNAREAAFGRARRRFMDAVKEDIKFRWCERRGGEPWTTTRSLLSALASTPAVLSPSCRWSLSVHKTFTNGNNPEATEGCWCLLMGTHFAISETPHPLVIALVLAADWLK